MHIEIQVALNFVISYLYNKLPRRRVNIFGEELEKALCDKFQGHWYPDKPFKGSAYRCLKTGDPIDSLLGRAARESGVPISDIMENLPNELSVWVDPGEVSYRIGEKGAVKILFTENSENHEDCHLADREVRKTFNAEAQCFRPIDVVNTTMNKLSLSPKTLPLPLPLPPYVSSPHSAASSSPTFKSSPNPNGGGSSGASLSGSNNVTSTATAAAFVQRAAQVPLTFTTATFAQTKFGSTKLKTCSKRTNSSSYRMSPTEFSNYIKHRAMQQQLHLRHNVGGTSAAALGVMESVSPARSLSPNPLALGDTKTTQAASATEPYFCHKIPMNLFPGYNGQRNIFESHYNTDPANRSSCFGSATTTVDADNTSYSSYLGPCYYGAAGDHRQLEHANSNKSCFDVDHSIPNASVEDACISVSVETTDESSNSSSPIAKPTAYVFPNPNTVATADETKVPADSAATDTTPGIVATPGAVNQDSSASAASNNNLSSFYGTGSAYQQLLVAN